MKQISLLDLNFLVGKKTTVTKFILEQIAKKKSFILLPTSLNDLASIDQDTKLKKSYKKVTYCTTDGMPLVWFFNLQLFFQRKYQPLERVYGPTLMKDVLVSGRTSYNHFFYGSSEQTLTDLSVNIRNFASHVKIVGMISPPFRAVTLEEEAEYITQIRKEETSVLWIGLSSPKQVELAVRWQRMLPNTAIMCVGAAFDFLANKTIMAPSWVQKMGLEWLFRLLHEPTRLWKRYLVVIPKFLIKKVYFLFFN